ncbi:two-component sensor histidine kinase, partial [Streptomyces sp. T-3]|nr:two-component sensor histidine kinase [Streptomyces sp. T-3]
IPPRFESPTADPTALPGSGARVVPRPAREPDAQTAEGHAGHDVSGFSEPDEIGSVRVDRGAETEGEGTGGR